MESYIPTNPHDNQGRLRVYLLSKSLHPAIPYDIQFCYCTLPSGLSLTEGISASSALSDISCHRNNFAIHHIPLAAPSVIPTVKVCHYYGTNIATSNLELVLSSVETLTSPLTVCSLGNYYSRIATTADGICSST